MLLVATEAVAAAAAVAEAGIWRWRGRRRVASTRRWGGGTATRSLTPARPSPGRPCCETSSAATPPSTPGSRRPGAAQQQQQEEEEEEEEEQEEGLPPLRNEGGFTSSLISALACLFGGKMALVFMGE